MAKKIAVCQMKGGVAKTTTTAITAACLTRKGFKVLCIDLDPQGNLGYLGNIPLKRDSGMRAILKEGLNHLDDEYDMSTMNDEALASLFDDGAPNYKVVHEQIISTDNYDIIPAGRGLSLLDSDLQTTGGQYVLRRAIDGAGLEDLYDFILIDTRPTSNGLVSNALVAADYVLAPITGEDFSIQATSDLYKLMKSVKKYNNANLTLLGILRTKWVARNDDCKSVDKKLQYINDNVLHTRIFSPIRSSNVVSKAINRKENLMDYKPKSVVAQDYVQFTDELLEEVERYD